MSFERNIVVDETGVPQLLELAQFLGNLFAGAITRRRWRPSARRDPLNAAGQQVECAVWRLPPEVHPRVQADKRLLERPGEVRVGIRQEYGDDPIVAVLRLLVERLFDLILEPSRCRVLPKAYGTACGLLQSERHFPLPWLARDQPPPIEPRTNLMLVLEPLCEFLDPVGA